MSGWTIPFSALTAFADPSVKFGLQFEANEDELQTQTPAGKATKRNDVPAIPAASGEDARKGADVVALDAFRKNSACLSLLPTGHNPVNSTFPQPFAFDPTARASYKARLAPERGRIDNDQCT